MTTTRLLVTHTVLDSILTYDQMAHPREGILLLHGRSDANQITISDVVIPPLAVHGAGFAQFPLHRLPIDRTIIGTAHSHPSGTLRPSIGDLNHYYGRIMIITAYPYQSQQDFAAFDRYGAVVKYHIVDDKASMSLHDDGV